MANISSRRAKIPQSLLPILLIFSVNSWMWHAPITSDALWQVTPILDLVVNQGVSEALHQVYQNAIYSNRPPIVYFLTLICFLLGVIIAKLTTLSWFVVNWMISSSIISITLLLVAKSYHRLFNRSINNVFSALSVFYAITTVSTSSFYHDTYSVWYSISWFGMSIPFMLLGLLFSVESESFKKTTTFVLIILLFVVNTYEGTFVGCVVLLTLITYLCIRNKDMSVLNGLLILLNSIGIIYWMVQIFAGTAMGAYSGTKLSFGIIPIFKTFVVQIIFSLPFFAQLRSYVETFHVDDYLFDFSRRTSFSFASISFWLLALILVILTILVLRQLLFRPSIYQKPTNGASSTIYQRLVLFSILILAIGPALMFSFSAKYILELPRYLTTYAGLPSLLIGSALVCILNLHRFDIRNTLSLKMLSVMLLVLTFTNFGLNTNSALISRERYPYLVNFDKLLQGKIDKFQFCLLLNQVEQSNYADLGLSTKNHISNITKKWHPEWTC